MRCMQLFSFPSLATCNLIQCLRLCTTQIPTAHKSGIEYLKTFLRTECSSQASRSRRCNIRYHDFPMSVPTNRSCARNALWTPAPKFWNDTWTFILINWKDSVCFSLNSESSLFTSSSIQGSQPEIPPLNLPVLHLLCLYLWKSCELFSGPITYSE